MHKHQPHHESRWQLVRDMLGFQAKLFIDGLRDFALIPISLVAALLDVISGEHPGHFQRVLDAGQRSERWINLFGQHPGTEAHATDGDTPTPATAGADSNHSASKPAAKVPKNLDAIIAKVEGLVVEQYRKGGMTAATKQVIDRGLDGLHKRSPLYPDRPAPETRSAKADARSEAGEASDQSESRDTTR